MVTWSVRDFRTALNNDQLIEKLSNTPGDGFIDLQNVNSDKSTNAHGTGIDPNTVVLIPTDEPQFGAIFVDNLENYRRYGMDRNIIRAKDTGTDLGTKWVTEKPGPRPQRDTQTGNATTDFRNQRSLPRTFVTGVGTGNTHTIKPPTGYFQYNRNEMAIYTDYFGGGNQGDVAVDLSTSPTDWAAGDYDVGARVWSAGAGTPRAYVCTVGGTSSIEPSHASGEADPGDGLKWRQTSNSKDSINGTAGGTVTAPRHTVGEPAQAAVGAG